MKLMKNASCPEGQISKKIPKSQPKRIFTCNGDKEEFKKKRMKRGVDQNKPKEIEIWDLKDCVHNENQNKDQTWVSDSIENKELFVIEFAK